MIKVISFDAHGTLFQESPEFFQKIAHILSLPEGKIDELKDTYSLLLNSMYEQLYYKEKVTNTLIESFWNTFYDAFCRAMNRDWELGSKVRDYTMTVKAWITLSENVVLLKKCREEFDCIVIISSEWDMSLYNILNSLHIYADKVYCSAVVGYAKRSALFWESIFARENIIPKEMIHVGNSEMEDIKIPSILGVTTFNIAEKNLFDKIRNCKEFVVSESII